jgi:hypothetical protein
MNYVYYAQNSASLSSAVDVFQKLLSWADGLERGVERNDDNAGHVLNLQ